MGHKLLPVRLDACFTIFALHPWMISFFFQYFVILYRILGRMYIIHLQFTLFIIKMLVEKNSNAFLWCAYRFKTLKKADSAEISKIESEMLAL
jgi:hypothetical protein